MGRGEGAPVARSPWLDSPRDFTLSLQMKLRRRGTPYKGRPGLNHLAYEVDDVDILPARLRAAGYRDSTVPNAHPYRKRIYFYDPEGNDWEFLQYLADDPEKRHDYELPDR